MNFKNYLNRITGNNNIYTRTGMMGMTLKELLEREKELGYQYRNIGIPEDEDLELSPDVERKIDANGKQGWFSRLVQSQEPKPTGFAVNMPKIQQSPVTSNKKQLQPDKVKKESMSQMTKGEQFLDSAIRNPVTKSVLPMASKMYTDGIDHLSEAKLNPNAKIIENINSLGNITKQYLYNYGVKAGEKGVLYNSNSDFSKKLASSPELKKFINDNKDSLLNKNIKVWDFKFDGITPNSLDRYFAVQHMKLISPYIDKDNIFHGRFIDNSDFEKRNPQTLIEKIKAIPNNFGYGLQEKGLYKNYYTVFDLLIDLNNK